MSAIVKDMSELSNILEKVRIYSTFFRVVNSDLTKKLLLFYISTFSVFEFIQTFVTLFPSVKVFVNKCVDSFRFSDPYKVMLY